ncbi:MULTISPECIES: site-specific integrase [unclassified Micromonospora]|uniref:site-specific integrase n=1 Tax=unclassified Micromonospora TaxID=2617518 RepID=UPI002FEFD970
MLTLAQVLKLAELVDERYRALILVTTFACLRWGEVSALQRQDIDADAGVIRVRQTFTEVRGFGLILGPPKSRAGLRAVSVPAAIGKLGVAGLHFHDLRHTGNTIAARTGASTRELMARMGHDSSQAAMIYQHATSEADRAIAQAVSDAVKAERKKAKRAATGTSAKPKAKGKKAGKKRG